MRTRTVRLGTVAALLALLAACGEGDAPETGEAGTEQAEVAPESRSGNGMEGLGQEVTDDWDWSAKTGGAIQDIPFPVYPGARLAAFAEGDGEKEPQALTLLTPDPVTEVVAFYGDELDGFRQQETYGTHTFWQGAETFDPLEDTGVANVQVRQAISSDSTYIYMFLPAGAH